MKGIPIELLSKMGKHEIEIDGVKITGRTCDNCEVVDKHMTDLVTHLESSTRVTQISFSSTNKVQVKPKVVGVDLKQCTSSHHVLVLYANTFCLIIRLELMLVGCENLPASLLSFFNDPGICFVGLVELPSLRFVKFDGLGVGVEVGELAARVLNKPGLIKSSLADIAREVGVPYEAPLAGGTAKEINRPAKFVFTDEEVKAVIREAFAHYQIAHKLFSLL